MHASLALSVLALAGSALAAPVVVYETKVVTVVETQEATAPTPAAQPQQNYQQHGGWNHHYSQKAPVVVTSQKPPVVVTTYAPAPKPTPQPQPAPQPEPTQPAPTSAAAPVQSSAPSTGGYMDVVNEWRQKVHLDPIKEDTEMENNILECLKENPGKMVHKLNKDSYGQVLAMGKMSDFEHVYVGGWLCELPKTPGLDGVCGEQSKGWTYADPTTGEQQTGHNEILMDKKYTKIGCAEYQGVVGCDFSYDVGAGTSY